MLAGFSNLPGNIAKLRGDIEPCVLDLKINMPDVLHALDGFRGLSYPFVPGERGCPEDLCDAESYALPGN